MSPKLKTRSTLGYTIYAVIGTLVEQGILLAILFWALPKFGIRIPLLVAVIIVALMLGFSYFTYHMGKQALTRKLILELESMIGCYGTVTTTIDPVGFVRIGNELWKAVSASRLEAGQYIIVTGVQGLKITVAPVN